MGSRLLLSAAAVLLAFALPATSHAADTDTGAHAKKHHYTHHYDRDGKQVGGHRYWYQTESFPYNDQYSAPGHYNNQSFWDRVQSGSNYPVGN
jgi:hypothetical protein